MKILLLLALLASESPVRSRYITAYCELHWQDQYNSFEACYENHMNTVGPTIFTANK